MLDQRYDEIVSSALDHWVDKHPCFTKQTLMDSFPWIQNDLADEEIRFWLQNGYVVDAGDHYQRTGFHPKTKLLFLDVDGVLNHSKSNDAIDSECLQNLAYIIEETGAVIILISSWKAGWSKDEKEFQDDDANYLDERLNSVGLSIADKSSRHTGHRVISVLDWVMKYDAESWVILDDDDFLYEESLLYNSCIATDYHRGGLTRALAEEAVTILQGI